jgi:hypothetical protein
MSPSRITAIVWEGGRWYPSMLSATDREGGGVEVVGGRDDEEEEEEEDEEGEEEDR